MTDRTTNLANNFKTTLSADMGSTDLTATVVTTTGGPSSPCFLVIDVNDPAKREVVYFDGTFTGTTFVTTAIGNRYAQGSAFGSGISHVTGAEVTQTALAQHVIDLNDRITADETVNASHRTGTPDAHHTQLHQSAHQSGGGDALSGILAATARVILRKAGVLVGTRRAVNLIEGTGITLTMADDAGNEEVDITVVGHAQNHQATHQSGGGDAQAGNLDATARVAARINSGGSAFARRRLNLIAGTGVSLAIADDAGNEEVDLTFTATAEGFATGDIKVSAVDAVPTGWLMCDGTEVSRATYAALFTALGSGTIYGAGNGTTTFNLPPASGRAIIGSGTGTGLTARAIGAQVGVETYTLTTGETPLKNHSHPLAVAHQTGSSHNHTNRGMAGEGNEGAPTGTSVNTDATSNATATAHQNMQPSLAFKVLVKT